MGYIQMMVPCGLDCFNCAMYMAVINEKPRKAVAGKIQLPEHEAVCNGCRAHGGIIPAPKRTEPYQVFQCISPKGLSFVLSVPISPAIVCIPTRTWLPSVRTTRRSSTYA